MTTTKPPKDSGDSSASAGKKNASRRGKTAPDSGAREEAAPPSEQAVADYLTRNPDFFLRHSALLEQMTPPVRSLGDGVSDFQRFMVERLKKKVHDLSETQHALIAAGQENDISLGRIHASALRLIEASSLQELGAIVAEEIPVLCGLDCALLGLERTHVPGTIVSLPRGMVNLWLGPADTMLHANTQGMPELFGVYAQRVRSFAVMRIEPRPDLVGVIAFGSSDPECFTPDQGTDFVAFLTGVIARQVNRMIVRAANSGKK